jgi:hypothetical protein
VSFNTFHAAMPPLTTLPPIPPAIPTDEQLMIARSVCPLIDTAATMPTVAIRALREIRRAERRAIGRFRGNFVR